MSLVGLSACGGSAEDAASPNNAVDEPRDDSTASDDSDSAPSESNESDTMGEDEDPYAWDMFSDDEFRRIQGQDIDETIDEGEPEDGEELTIEDSSEGDGEELVGDEPVPDLDPCTLLTLDEWAEIVGTTATDVEQLPLEYGEVCGYLESSDTQRVAIGVVKWFVEPGDTGVDSTTRTEDRYGHQGRTTTWDPITVGDSQALFASGLPVAKSSLIVVSLDDETDLVIEVSSTTPNADSHRDVGSQVGAIALPRARA